MKDDRDIESLLRRYQPAGPPPRLRERIVHPQLATRRAWPWAAAAAAMLIATVGLHAASARLAGAWIEPVADARAQAIAEMADILGGDVGAQRLAEEIIARDEAIKDGQSVGPSGTER